MRVSNQISESFLVLAALSGVMVISALTSQLIQNSTASSQTSKQTNLSSSQGWRAAIFRGLTVGKSSLTDARRVFGQPNWIVPEADRDESDADPPVHYGYNKGGEFPGRLTIIVGEKTKKIIAISNTPEGLSKEAALRHLGADFVIGRYRFCPNFDGPTAPVYEDPSGSISNIEYRSRGIVLYTDTEGNVSEIVYVAGRTAPASVKECEKLKRVGSGKR